MPDYSDRCKIPYPLGEDDANTIDETGQATAEQLDRLVAGLSLGTDSGACVLSYSSFRVTESSPATYAIDVNGGVCWIRHETSAHQGSHFNGRGLVPYELSDSAPETLIPTAAHGSLPRIDAVVATLLDDDPDTIAELSIVAGTATSGADLDNLNGAAAIPASSILLAYILIPAGGGTINNADISDERRIKDISVPYPVAAGTAGTPHQPQLIAGLSGVEDLSALLPGPTLASTLLATDYVNISAAQGLAIPVMLGRKLRGANIFAFSYFLGATNPATKDMCIALYTQSGRRVATATHNFTGAAGTYQDVQESFDEGTVDLEPGLYYLYAGWASSSTENVAFYSYWAGTTAMSPVPQPIVLGRWQLSYATLPLTPPERLASFTSSIITPIGVSPYYVPFMTILEV